MLSRVRPTQGTPPTSEGLSPVHCMLHVPHPHSCSTTPPTSERQNKTCLAMLGVPGVGERMGGKGVLGWWAP